MKFSLRERTGISTGMPPAWSTPFFTFSASTLKCRWHGLISLQVLRIAMTGFPTQSAGPRPIWRRRERCPKVRRSFGPNQRKLRSCSGVRRVVIGKVVGVYRVGFAAAQFSLDRLGILEQALRHHENVLIDRQSNRVRICM